MELDPTVAASICLGLALKKNFEAYESMNNIQGVIEWLLGVKACCVTSLGAKDCGMISKALLKW